MATNQPLNQVANVSVAGPRLLSVQVWDKSLVKAVEMAIRDSGLGLNPQTEGQVIRVPMPPLTQERRNDLVKTAAQIRRGRQGRHPRRPPRRHGADQGARRRTRSADQPGRGQGLVGRGRRS